MVGAKIQPYHDFREANIPIKSVESISVLWRLRGDFPGFLAITYNLTFKRHLKTFQIYTILRIRRIAECKYVCDPILCYGYLTEATEYPLLRAVT
jgi:hypothetical protein